MRFATLIWAGLAHRPTRAILTLVCIVVAFFLFGVLHGFSALLRGTSSDASTARLIVTSRSGLYATLPESLRGRIQAVEGVAQVDANAILPAYFRERRDIVPVVALDPALAFAMYGEWHIDAPSLAQMAATRTGALVGKELARRHGWRVGDDIPLQAFASPKRDGSLTWTFKLVGIYEAQSSEQGNAMLINYGYFDQERSGENGSVNYFVVGVRDATLLGAVAFAIDDLFANSTDATLTQSEKQFTEAMINQLGDIDFVVTAVLAAVLATLLLVIATTMIQSMDERVPELGVLKTLGLTDRGVFVLLLAESAFLCITGAVLGIGAANLILPLGQAVTGTSHLPTTTLVLGLLVALVLSVLTGLVPAVRAARLSIVESLAVK